MHLLTVGMRSSPILKRNWSCTHPFLSTMLLDFAGLNSIPVPAIILHRSSRIHRPSGNDLAIMVRSSMNALTGACWIPLARTAPLLGFSTVLTKRFIAAANKMTEMVHPVTMPFSYRCQPVVKSPQVNRILKRLKYSCRRCWTFPGTWYACSVRSTSLWGTVPYASDISSHRYIEHLYIFKYFASKQLFLNSLII